MPFDALLSAPFGRALGWTLLHAVWQGGLVALALAGALALLRHHTARARYAVSCAALALLLVLPAVTLGVLYVPDAPPVPAAATTVGEQAPAATPVPEGLSATPASAPQRLDAALPWLVSFWLLGVLLLSVRYLGGWIYTVRLRHAGRRPVGQHWEDLLRGVVATMGVTRPVRLFASTRAAVPTVVGWLRPVILLPVAAFTGLTTRQVELILAHELAHVRRHDYLVNLLQAAAETLLFYHPAVWWISHHIRVAREHCCDDAVVAACGDVATYAEALTRLERTRHAAPRMAFAATDGPLLGRIRRLLAAPAGRPSRAARWMVGFLFVAVLALGLHLPAAVQSAWLHAQHWISGRPSFETVPPSRTMLRFPSETADPGAIRVTSGTTTLQEDTDYVVNDDGSVTITNSAYLTAGRDIALDHEEQAVDRAFQDLHHGSARRRVQAVERLGTLTTGDVTPVLVKMIGEDPSPAVRMAVLDALRDRADGSGLPWIINVAQTHRDRALRLEAVQILGDYPTRDVVPLLERIAFEDADEAVQMEALDALRDLPGDRGTLYLMRIAERHPNARLRNEAVQALSRQPSEKVVPLLERIAFEDADEAVQMEALDALRDLPYGLGTASLRTIARRHPDRALRAEARDVLGWDD